MRFHVSRRSAGLAAGLLMAAVLPACGGGGGNNNNPTPVPTPTPRTTTTVYSQGFSVEAGFGGGNPNFGAVDVNIPNTGDVAVTFDWTFASSDIDLVVSSISCTDGGGAYVGSCTVFGSDKGFTKPARVNLTVTSPGFIRIWVYNFATIRESGVMNVTLTR